MAVNVKNLTSATNNLNAKDVALTADILEKIVETKNKDPKVKCPLDGNCKIIQ